MIGAYVIGAEEVISKFEKFPAILRVELRRRITALAAKTQAYVMQNKLSGDPLHVRSGTLRRSINYKIVEDVKSLFAIVGTNVWYGKIHEYGGQIKAHVRTISVAFGKPLKFPVHVLVNAFTMPERSFLRSSLFAMKPEIVKSLTGAVPVVLRQSGLA
jgi:phage gpG-like protein